MFMLKRSLLISYFLVFSLVFSLVVFSLVFSFNNIKSLFLLYQVNLSQMFSNFKMKEYIKILN